MMRALLKAVRIILEAIIGFFGPYALLGEGVKYGTAGSLQDGKKIWILAKLPDKYIIKGEQIDPYLVFGSSHIPRQEKRRTGVHSLKLW